MYFRYIKHLKFHLLIFSFFIYMQKLDRSLIPATHQLQLTISREPEIIYLKNKIEVQLLHLNETQLIRIDFMFKGGQWLEKHPQQARFAFSQLKEGTKTYSADSISEKLDFLGATITSSTNLSYSYLTIQCLRKHLKEVLQIVSSMLNEPLYDAVKLQIAVNQARTAFLINQKKVATVCRNKFYAEILGQSHPMGRYQTVEDYDSLTTKHLQDYYNENITSRNCSLFITGGYENEDIDLIFQLFGEGQWGGTNNQAPQIKPIPATPFKERHFSVKMPEPTVQAAVKVGCLLPMQDDADMPYIRLLSVLLSGYFGSRLMNSIRETKGLTYDISGSLLSIPFQTVYVIQTETPNACVQQVIDEIYIELQKLCLEPIPDEELMQVKNYIIGNVLRRCELTFNLPSLLMGLSFRGKTLHDFVESNQKINQVDTTLLLNIAKKYFSPERFVDCFALG